MKNYEPKKTIRGVYNHNKVGDYGFIDVEGEKKGYYVFSFNRNGAISGDEVLAEVKIFRGKTEAVVKKIIKRADNIFIGKIKIIKGNNFGFVILKEKLLNKDIFIANKNLFGAVNNDIVGVRIISWSGRRPEGKVVKILGKKDNDNIDLDSIILESGFLEGFSYEVKKELEKFNNKISFKERKNRIDLTKLLTFTIDGEDAKDLDDAISIKIKDNGDYLLYVHIADVCNYVKENSYLDKDALKRGTSVYLADRVIPMLPEKLSNNLCSLNPNTEKLTLTCEIRLDNNGKLKKSRVYESIIKSDYRLTYREVDEIVSGKKILGADLMFGGKVNEVLLKSLHLSEELRKKIEKAKVISGVLNFNFTETKIIFEESENGTKKVKEIIEYLKYKSNKLIEEFMIMANESVSREFSSYPFLYRIHEEPKSEDVEKLQGILDLFGIKYRFKKANTREFAQLLELIGKGDKEKVLFIQKMILRTLTKAIYSHENYGHFGLGLDFYSHFTSPIRRYPDLQIHRIIKEKLNKTLNKRKILEYKSKLPIIAKKTSTQEKKAELLEYKVRDYFIVRYYKNRIGEEFEGNISGMIPKGLFVQLKDTTEGFVDGSTGVFNEQLLEYRNLISGKNLRLGDKVKVKLVEADTFTNTLRFELIKEHLRNSHLEKK
ncbi:ribonuclease R [Candidatus Gracilibacteria bacterium]|nr:MAG: ribonuclease R [Candidatus Gracilibacteria bacterium]